jgi:glycosyltransferase involved in cell wall biosynthesis
MSGAAQMKITCVLGPFLPVPPIRGGAVERIFQNLCEVFADIGHDVTIVSRRFEKLPNQEIINGVKYLRVASFDQPKSMLLYRLLDIMYAVRVCLALPKSDVTITNSVSLPLFIPRGRAGVIYMSVARFPKGQMAAYRRVDRMQTVSSHVGDAVRQQSPSVAHLVKTVPNALSRTFANAIDEFRGARQKEILFVGRIAHEKGIDILVRAFKIVHETFPDWKLTIVGPHLSAQGGDGEECLSELKALAADAQASVDFTGPVFQEERLVEHFKRCEIFVYPSVAARGEALPMAPVEAMACGCAVVVSSLDCFDDYLHDNQNGLVFDESDESGAALADKLIMLMHDKALRDRLASAAARTARTYTREAVAQTFLADFQALHTALSSTS